MTLLLIHEWVFNGRALSKARCEISRFPRQLACLSSQALDHYKKVLAGAWRDCRYALKKRVRALLPHLSIDNTQSKIITTSVSPRQQVIVCAGYLTWSIKQ